MSEDKSVIGKVGLAPTIPEFCKPSNQAAGGTSQNPKWSIGGEVLAGGVEVKQQPVTAPCGGEVLGLFPKPKTIFAPTGDTLEKLKELTATFAKDSAILAPKANDVQVGGSHYKITAIQPWDYVIANNLGYLQGNIIKYVTRYADKDGMKDLLKLRHYVDKLIEVCEAGGVRKA